jgi:PUA domain
MHVAHRRRMRCARADGLDLWCVLAVPVKGQLHVDAGCADALLRKKNLYAAGVTRVDGAFGAMDAVEVASQGALIARCLVNCSSQVRPREAADLARCAACTKTKFGWRVGLPCVHIVLHMSAPSLLCSDALAALSAGSCPDERLALIELSRGHQAGLSRRSQLAQQHCIVDSSHRSNLPELTHRRRTCAEC